MKKEFWITKSFLKFIKQQQTENELHALISSTQKLRDACCIELIIDISTDYYNRNRTKILYVELASPQVIEPLTLLLNRQLS